MLHINITFIIINNNNKILIVIIFLKAIKHLSLIVV